LFDFGVVVCQFLDDLFADFIEIVLAVTGFGYCLALSVEFQQLFEDV
jgi:hypothetical protein